MDLDFRKQDADNLAEFELSDDMLEKLIEEKFLRARAYYEALNQREIPLTEDR